MTTTVIPDVKQDHPESPELQTVAADLTDASRDSRPRLARFNAAADDRPRPL